MEGQTTKSKPTCGPLYNEARETARSFPEHLTFSLGFMTGEAEKIYLGACVAAMFRPGSPESMQIQELFAKRLQQIYGVEPLVFFDELWIFRPTTDVIVAMESMRRAEKNSSEYHRIRAELCGIPLKWIDYEFHKRYAKGPTTDV